jgi:hypothetical protein
VAKGAAVSWSHSPSKASSSEGPYFAASIAAVLAASQASRLDNEPPASNRPHMADLVLKLDVDVTIA